MTSQQQPVTKGSLGGSGMRGAPLDCPSEPRVCVSHTDLAALHPEEGVYIPGQQQAHPSEPLHCGDPGEAGGSPPHALRCVGGKGLVISAPDPNQCWGLGLRLPVSVAVRLLGSPAVQRPGGSEVRWSHRAARCVWSSILALQWVLEVGLGNGQPHSARSP